MAISTEYIVSFTRHSVSIPTLVCWAAVRGKLSQLVPGLVALWTRLPALIHVITSKVRAVEGQSYQLGEVESAKDDHFTHRDDCEIMCEVLYAPDKDTWEMDLIFIHGLNGSTVKTWRQGDWNLKYQEVDRVALRKHASNLELNFNHEVCPRCHQLKKKTNRSLSTLNNATRNQRPTLRSYSVPNRVARDVNLDSFCRDNITTRREDLADFEPNDSFDSEHLSDSDDDILFFNVSEQWTTESNNENNRNTSENDSKTIQLDSNADSFQDEKKTYIDMSKCDSNSLYEEDESTISKEDHKSAIEMFYCDLNASCDMSEDNVDIRISKTDDSLKKMGKICCETTNTDRINVCNTESYLKESKVNDICESLMNSCDIRNTHVTNSDVREKLNYTNSCDLDIKKTDQSHMNLDLKMIPERLYDNIKVYSSNIHSSNESIYDKSINCLNLEGLDAEIQERSDSKDTINGTNNNKKMFNKQDGSSDRSSFDEYSDLENDFKDFFNFNSDFSDQSYASRPQEDLERLTFDFLREFEGLDDCEADDHGCADKNEFYRKSEGARCAKNALTFCCCESSKENTNSCDGDEKQTTEGLSSCWPRDWLPLDCPDARVISLSYTTDQNLWRPIWIKPYTRSSMEQRCGEMVRLLADHGVGQRPIVWVGHSKGGLFIKEMFSNGYESWIKEGCLSDRGRIYNNTKGLVFYSVPHRGSPLANITLPPLLRVSSELQEIQYESEFVLRLHERFLAAVKGSEVEPAVLSYSETRRTLIGALYLSIVSPQSADPGVGSVFGVSLDHCEICKPTSRSCFLYKELLSVIHYIKTSFEYLQRT